MAGMIAGRHLLQLQSSLGSGTLPGPRPRSAAAVAQVFQSQLGDAARGHTDGDGAGTAACHRVEEVQTGAERQLNFSMPQGHPLENLSQRKLRKPVSANSLMKRRPNRCLLPSLLCGPRPSSQPLRGGILQVQVWVTGVDCFVPRLPSKIQHLSFFLSHFACSHHDGSCTCLDPVCLCTSMFLH